ncbi:hypothetical protein CsatB_014965 [Cannabis sativa]
MAEAPSKVDGSNPISPQCPERDGENLLLIDAFFLLTIEADPNLGFQGLRTSIWL